MSYYTADTRDTDFGLSKLFSESLSELFDENIQNFNTDFLNETDSEDSGDEEKTIDYGDISFVNELEKVNKMFANLKRELLFNGIDDWPCEIKVVKYVVDETPIEEVEIDEDLREYYFTRNEMDNEDSFIELDTSTSPNIPFEDRNTNEECITKRPKYFWFF